MRVLLVEVYVEMKADAAVALRFSTGRVQYMTHSVRQTRRPTRGGLLCRLQQPRGRPPRARGRFRALLRWHAIPTLH